MDDYQIETLTPNKSGGQSVGMSCPGVKVTHIPTGITASCSYERSQYKNKQIAIEMIEWGLATIGIKP